MDWNLKAQSWDFTQLEPDAFKNSYTVVEHSNSTNFSFDLKLGRVRDLGTKYVVSEQPGVVKSAASKRARGCGNGGQALSCLVDGCVSDLSNDRDYHRRHKVCEAHSKTPQVTIGGLKQRFCQQCSRFHSLEEFDEGKRSCRKRLDGHNRRRRKPQPEPLSCSILSHYQGSQLLPFSSSYVNPSTSAGISYTETNPRLHDKHNMYLGSSSSNDTVYKNRKHVSFLDTKSSVCQPIDKTIDFSENGNGWSKTLYHMFTNPGHESDCALSLLSSGIGLRQTEQDHNLISFLQPFNSGENGSVSNADISYSGMFHFTYDDAFNWQ